MKHIIYIVCLNLHMVYAAFECAFLVGVFGQSWA